MFPLPSLEWPKGCREDAKYSGYIFYINAIREVHITKCIYVKLHKVSAAVLD
ncbi:uncharacterized protein NEPG_00754 [Nematocida parisii ERTm1]|uniref:uncharacterized protein n=1 Tax=Nematocida parisii (strain ERTm1 / ATCC PRA-289) TaxID=881290 RepID=UPI000264BA04|nr:uncharacterized protein NEPG_00754 [Nematocida parisii ERTm1]EIJ94087.1 hypothetical protein NEPG_00754 [Nematocida parisii ERTm1]|eukprot:XP_013058583.1 hypothetical protein NEPG_00754 [Nematocida parisii ERTm1]